MTATPSIQRLTSRSLISLSGPDWRDFLQNLISQDVEALQPGEMRFGALLTPQGRLLYDLFVVGRADGAWLDVEAAEREALILRLTMYRLRAKVVISADDTPVMAAFPALEGPGWCQDPRLAALGARGYGVAEAPNVADDAYDRHRLELGVPGPDDWGSDKNYPIEADFDLLNGVDFKKGCFVGQETTSRMKRRGLIKSRMAPIAFDGPPPAFGAEILAGDLRAGLVLSGCEGRAMALLRLDRLSGDLKVDGRPVRVDWPAWLPAQ